MVRYWCYYSNTSIYTVSPICMIFTTQKTRLRTSFLCNNITDWTQRVH